jgi:uncharacterized protein YajQ (UPF0234 family)
MAKDETFDITTGVDLQEVDNAVNQARREITNRFDFKNILVEIDYDRVKAKIGVHTTDEYKANAIWEVLQQRLVSRNVPLKNVKRGTLQEAGGSTVREDIALVQSIDTDLGKKIVKFIKDQKFKKANASLQGDSIRVSSPSREELQAVIKAVKGEDWGIELKFGNYR